MMQIETILTESRTKAMVEGVSKKRVLELLAETFAENVEHLNVDELYQALINREKLGTTGIGSGIAIPHCRFNTNGQIYCTCFTLANPVDFDAVDNEPVDIIFAMLVPENAESSHLAMLASLAELLQSPGIVGQLRAATTNQELYIAATQCSQT